nr:uncharacterized protein LOC107406114 isoform X12 [Ziziphus jujuba var. spinosa]
MDNNNWRPIQGGEPTMETSDWRTQCLLDSRLRIVNKIMDTLKKHLPFSGQEGLHELKKIAVRFEEKIYTAATSQSDYLRKISIKMLLMETKSQNTMASSLLSNTVGTSNRPPDPVLTDNNNWRPIQSGEPTMDTSDWRSQLQPDSRQKIINKIMDTLKKNLPYSGQEGLHELKKIAVRFEEKIYNAAISQSDYLRKISLKMLSMETTCPNTMADSLPSHTVGTSSKTPDPGNVFKRSLRVRRKKNALKRVKKKQ